MKPNKKKTYPTYAGGGFFNNNKFGQIVGNYGKALADAGLSTFGASNVIKDSDYKGGSAKDFARGAKIVGGINAAVAPIAMNMVAPGSGQLISGVQKTVGGFNPQDPSQYNEDGSLKDPGIAQFQQGIASAGNIAGQAQGMGLFAMGGMQYANGGTGQINSEVEKQENAMTPNGQFTQFNGPSHSNGGIKTDMAPGTMIFSDKLKAPGTNKTFAELNKVNDTTKLEKKFAKLPQNAYTNNSKKVQEMGMLKSSDMLFAMQEQLKKDKVAAYAKKMGVQMPSMDNEQMEPQGLPEQIEGEYKHGGMYPMGGVKLPMYPNGTRVTLSKPEYEQAQRDSSTLYRSGIKYPTMGQQGTDAGVAEAYHRLYSRGAAKPISGQFSQSYAGYDPSHPSVKFAKPTMVPYNEDNFTVNEEPQQVRKPATFNIATPKTFEYINNPKYGTYQEQWDRQFPQKAYGGYMNKYPDGGTIPPQRFTYRALGIEPTRMTPLTEEEVSLNPNRFNYRNLDVEKVRMSKPFEYRNLEIEPTRMSELSEDEEVEMMSRPNPILAQRPNVKYSSGLKVYPKLSYGGTLPKYANGIKVPESARFVAPTVYESEGDNVVVPGTPSQEPDFTNVLGPDKYNTFGKPLDTWDALRLNKSAWDADYLNNPNAKNPNTLPPSPQGFDWKNAAGQVGMGLLQNAGNLYNLSRYNKPEVEKYERKQVEKVDPTAAIRDAKMQAKAAEYDIRGAVGGNTGAYLSNRLGLASKNIQDIDRITQQYGNINAEIQNRANQYNTGLAMQEVIANAQNRARDRSGKGEAVTYTGENIAQQMLDAKKGKMDEKRLAMYQSYFNNPQFKAAMKKAGYDVG